MNDKYNYMDALKADIKEYINENININDFDSIDDLNDYLNDTLFITDSVTGNASGSYTFNSYTAKQYVFNNMDIVSDMINDDFITSDEFTKYMCNESYETIDVCIRCYLLFDCITDVLSDYITEF